MASAGHKTRYHHAGFAPRANPERTRPSGPAFAYHQAGSAVSGTAIVAASPRKSTRARSPSRWIADRLEVVRLAQVAPERMGDERPHRPRVGGDDGQRGFLRDDRAPVPADGDRRRLEPEQRRLQPQLDRIAAGHVDAPEAREVGQPARQLARRRVAGVGVFAEHLGLLAYLAAGGDREVGEAALGARAGDLDACGRRAPAPAPPRSPAPARSARAPGSASRAPPRRAPWPPRALARGRGPRDRGRRCSRPSHRGAGA